MRSVGGVYNKFGKHLPLLSRPVTCDDDNDDYYYYHYYGSVRRFTLYLINHEEDEAML